MSRNMPLVSLLLCVYNGEEYIRDTLDSIVAQTYQNWELVVIDDCSSDTTPEILEAYAARDQRIRISRNPQNLRLQKSLNRGLSLVKGEYVVRIDADDVCALNRLERQVAFMQAHPELSLSFCRFLLLRNGAIVRQPFNMRADPDAVRALLLVTNPVIHPGVIARADAICNLRYREDLTCTEDLELWQRMDMNGMKIAAQDEYLLLYRIHDKQITANSSQRQRDEFARVTREYYRNMLFELTYEQLAFLTTGMYFADHMDADQLAGFIDAVRGANREKRAYKQSALDYAMMEIVLKYKNEGIGRQDLIRLLRRFPPLFVARELVRRKISNMMGKQKIECMKCGTGKEYPWA